MPESGFDTSQIKDWRSIVTLIVFVLTNLNVLFPFHIPIHVPRPLWYAVGDGLAALRVISPRRDGAQEPPSEEKRPVPSSVRLDFPMNYVTAPLIADLFLLAIVAIGRQEVHDGTIGANNISPIDILVFFLTLAYVAISIDASGLIRYLAFRVLQWGGKSGHRLFFYLYLFFFVLGSVIGNDPIILSGTAFLAYMTRVSSNIKHPRAWIHAQFAVANISSAILVSSNPTNLVLAGAFKIKFIHYTANVIVPVIITGIVLFPFLRYIVFASDFLIPRSIEMHELPPEARNKPPVNPNIPHARENIEDQGNNLSDDGQVQLLSLEEIMNPFVDRGGAAFGAVVMTATLVTILALNAASTGTGEHAVFWVTLPAAFVMFCWDLASGWYHRKETRAIARTCRQELEAKRARREAEANLAAAENDTGDSTATMELDPLPQPSPEAQWQSQGGGADGTGPFANGDDQIKATGSICTRPADPSDRRPATPTPLAPEKDEGHTLEYRAQLESPVSMPAPEDDPGPGRPTLVSRTADAYRWSQETFPTATAVLAHLPIALVPFSFAMFVLVQALVTKGWVSVFAHGWDHWVAKTGIVGCIGGMGFLSVILCNFAGTNIGATILLSRVIQGWQEIHRNNGIPISDRTFWAAVYSMALGVNYGAFSTAFSASLAGLLWRHILARKHITVLRRDFARTNLPIIAIAMTVGCVVLVCEVYIIRDTTPYHL